MAVYLIHFKLIHFKEKFHHAQHYIGYTNGDSLEQRIQRHRSGDGARLLRAVSQAGIDWEVVRVWPDGDWELERRLKNRKKAKQLCPICRGCQT